MKWWRIEGREGGEGGGQALKRLPSAWEELSTMCKGWMSCKRAGRPKSRRLVSEEERKSKLPVFDVSYECNLCKFLMVIY